MPLARDAVTVEKFRGKVVGYLSLERNVSIASAAVFIIALGEELWKKFLPKYLEALGATAGVVGLFGTAQDFFDAVYQYPGGWIADRFGRRRAFLIFVTLAFYDLFKRVDRRLAVLIVLLGGVLPSAIYFANIFTDAGALTLARGGGGLLTAHGANVLAAFDQPQREALMMLFLHLHNQVNNAAQIFWGLWLLPVAILIYRSRLLPRFVGIWLALNGLAYIAMSLMAFLWPRYAGRVENLIFPALMGELVLMLWLIIRGVNVKKWENMKAA